MFSILACAKRNGDGTFDAEVAVTLYDDRTSKAIVKTDQRTIAAGLASRDAALVIAEQWVTTNLFPVVKRLPMAKP